MYVSLTMMLATSKQVFKIKTCRNLFKNLNQNNFVYYM